MTDLGAVERAAGGIKVLITWKVWATPGAGNKGEAKVDEWPMSWPRGWPIPIPGDAIEMDGRIVGFVSHRSFDPVDERIIIALR